MALNYMVGGKKPHGNSGGHGGSNNLVGQLAGQFLGGGKHSNQSHGGGSNNLVGQLAGSLLGGGKHSNQQQQHGQTGHSNSSAGGLGGLGGLVGGFLGGHNSVRQCPKCSNMKRGLIQTPEQQTSRLRLLSQCRTADL